MMHSSVALRQLFVLCVLLASAVRGALAKDEVVVEIISPNPDGEPVSYDHSYSSMVTLYIENDDKSKTPSGWSTRKEDGAEKDTPFEFTPGVNLIQGWTNGVVQMREGERALLHVPSSLAYGPAPMGRPGGSFYIPANANLLFDIEIIDKVAPKVPRTELDL